MIFFSAIADVIAQGFGLIKVGIDASAKVKVAKAEAEIERAKREQSAEADWDIEALRASQSSWKDEYLTMIVSYPFIINFLPYPELQQAVAEGWLRLAQAPSWYPVLFMGICAASFGLRWWFKQKLVG